MRTRIPFDAARPGCARRGRKATALALLFAFALLAAPGARAQEPVAEGSTVRVVVAVLPFEVHSARPLEYLEGSLADRLGARLEESGRIEVLERLTLRESLAGFGESRSEDAVRRLARELGADWVVFGSLTELAGQYSLDVRVTPVESRVASTTLTYSASDDEALLGRMDELASRVAGLVTGGEQQLQVVSVTVEGARNLERVTAALRLREGDNFSSALLREDMSRLQALPDVATASVATESAPGGMKVVYRVVPTERLPARELGAVSSSSPDRVAGIEIRGNKRIEAAAIRARLGTRVGGALNQPQISEDVREVHQLGFFSNVKVLLAPSPAGRIVIFEVEENPVVRQVTLTGNDEVDEEKIKDNLTLTTGATLDLPLLFENRQRIEAIYRAEGFYLAKVRHEVETLPGDAVAIHFSVDEGKKPKLRSIEFVGNEAFEDEELLDGFKTKTWAWHSFATRFFDKSGTYSEPLFMQDLRTVSDRYLDNGYIRAEVGDPEVDTEGGDLNVRVPITEGEQFHVRSLDVRGDETIDVKRLRLGLNLKEGQIFDRSALNDDIEVLEHQYTDRGFYAAEVDPLTRVDDGERSVDVTFEVEKGPLYFLRKLDIAGNTNTVDSVVRREMQMVEGELYSARALDISKRRVEGLGYFEEVNIEPKLTDHPDQLDLDMSVVERPTGSLSFGAGFSSRDGFVLSSSVSQSNLFGRGYGGSVSADLGKRTNRYSINVSDPYFLGSTFGFQARTFQTDIEFRNFDLDTLGLELALSHLLDNAGRTRAFLRYSWSKRDVRRRVGVRAASPIQREVASAGETTSLLGFSLRRDTRNDRIAPTFGELSDLSFDFAGLGGFSQFLRFEARNVRYLRNPRWVPRWLPSSQTGTWVLGARFGWVLPFNDVADFDFSNANPYTGDIDDLGLMFDEPDHEANAPRRLDQIDLDIDLPLSERYFLGGIGRYQLRGFESRSVGPRRATLVPVAISTYNEDIEDGNRVVFELAGRRRGVCGANAAGDTVNEDIRCNSYTDRDPEDYDNINETDVIGGNKFLSGTVEYRFPISEGLGLIGIAFLDFGNAFGEEEDVWDLGLWRVGTGLGALWFSPFGPLQAFFGIPLDPYEDEDSSVFEFSVGGQAF